MRRVLPMILLVVAVAPIARAAEIVRYDFVATMSDGVTLDASVYLPSGAAEDAELPLIVRQHGGGSNKDNPYDVGYLRAAVATGRFAGLMYSHRGHGASGGRFDFFGERTTTDVSEMLDAVEAHLGAQIDTGTVGMTGYSQGGGASLLPAARDRRIKAVAVGQTFASLNHALNPNDCFKLSWATGIFTAAYKVSGARTEDEHALRWGATWYTDTEDLPLGVVPSTTEEMAARSPETFVGQLDVPIFWTQAWEDQLFPGDHPQRVLEPLRARGVPVHYWFSSGGHAAGPNFPAEEATREQAMVEWFEEFLLGVEHGYASGARPLVDYWQRTQPGKPGEWVHRTASAWPVPEAERVAMYARADGSLAAEPGDGPVATIVNDLASANVANDAIVHEVLGRIPGMGDVLRAIPESENPLDTATFTSAPLTQRFDVVGAPALVVPVTSTAQTVMQLSAKVWDVGDDGARLVWRGCATFDPQADVAPSFELWPNAHAFEPGRRIVLTISHVDAPMFKPDIEPAVTEILAGARVELPVIP